MFYTIFSQNTKHIEQILHHASSMEIVSFVNEIECQVIYIRNVNQIYALL